MAGASGPDGIDRSSSFLLLSRERNMFMSVPILSFVGRSNSGKTTLIERVIPELVRAGYKVATVKHAGHGFDLDTEGKDSWRHKQAGASSVVIISKSSLAMFADVSDHMNVEDVRERYLDASYDLILAEGWRSEGYPKIVVVRDQIGEVPVSQDGLLAVVSNKPVETSVPLLAPDDVAGVAALIIRHFPKPQRDDAYILRHCARSDRGRRSGFRGSCGSADQPPEILCQLSHHSAGL